MMWGMTIFRGSFDMYTIYIIENDLLFSSSLKLLLKVYCDNHSHFKFNKICLITHNFDNFIKELPKSSSKNTIYLLDLELGHKLNGLVIAKKIRKFDHDGYIIFLTSHVELTGCAFNYNIKALNFIDKGNPNFKQLLFGAFDQICLETQHSTSKRLVAEESNNLVYSYKSFHYKIPMNEILYIETHGLKRCLLIHTIETTYEYPKSLNELLAILPENFYRCHKSYIVNRFQIKNIEIAPPQYIAHFPDNRFCYISKKYINNLMDLI